MKTKRLLSILSASLLMSTPVFAQDLVIPNGNFEGTFLTEATENNPVGTPESWIINTQAATITPSIEVSDVNEGTQSLKLEVSELVDGKTNDDWIHKAGIKSEKIAIAGGKTYKISVWLKSSVANKKFALGVNKSNQDRTKSFQGLNGNAPMLKALSTEWEKYDFIFELDAETREKTDQKDNNNKWIYAGYPVTHIELLFGAGGDVGTVYMDNMTIEETSGDPNWYKASNGDFEQGTLGWVEALHNGSATTISEETNADNVYEGSKSAKVEVTSMGTSSLVGSVGMAMANYARVFTDQQYKVSVMAKSAVTDKKFQYKVVLYDDNNSRVGQPTFSTVTLTDTWTEYAINLDFNNLESLKLVSGKTKEDIKYIKVFLGAGDVPENIGVSYFDNFKIEVDKAAPSFTNAPSQAIEVTAETAYSFTLTAEDTEQSTAINFKKVSGPEWLLVSEDGMISGTPSSSDVQAESYDLVVRATDGHFVSSETTIQYTVTGGVSTDLTIGDITATSATEGIAYSHQVSAVDSDPSGGAITYSLVNNPSWLSIDANGLLSGTPASADVSAGIQVTVQAENTNNVTAEKSFTLVVVANAVPVVTGLPTTWEMTTGATTTLQVSASDAEMAVLTYTLVDNPNWISISSTGELSANAPAEASSGSFKVKVTDEHGKFTEETLAYNVSVVASIGDAITARQINIYPNPVVSYLNIEMQSAISQINIYDISGKLKLVQATNLVDKVNVSHLQKGTYIVEAISQSGLSFKTKFVKQ